jgi:hypothetical protein
LGPAFGAIGALPFGGEIRAEVEGTVVVAKANPMNQTDDGLDTYLAVEKILEPRPTGP